MANDLLSQLSAAADTLGMTVKNRVQSLFDDHKKFLSGGTIQSPIETIVLLDENFPYWIKLENPDPSNPKNWVGVKSSAVIPLLNAGSFEVKGFRYDENRARALLDVPNLLRTPDCIHVNLREAHRGHGGIQGRHMYVIGTKNGNRKVGFTIKNAHHGKVVLVTSFTTTPGWVYECAEDPAIYVRPGKACECCKTNKKTTP